MAWSQYLPKDRVKWSQGNNSCPIWPAEPDLDAIRRVVVSSLIGDGNEDDDGCDITIHFLANGAHHKIYEVTRPLWDISYLLRVAIAVDPELKMESEMATMAFLRQNTAIPVPRPVAWSSRVDERLGYEWSLLEKIPGVELREIWREVPWDKKVDIAKTMAAFMAQIWDPAFRQARIGSLYFAQPQGGQQGAGIGRGSSSGSSGDNKTTQQPQPDVLPRTVQADQTGQHGFAVGPVVDGAFFAGRRRFLGCDRGPYNSCKDWLKALIEVEQEFIRSARVLLESRSEAPEEYREESAWATAVEEEVEVDEDDFLDEYDAMMENCADYMHVLARLFPEGSEACIGPARFSLHHCDLRGANIIVDPQTFEITGIIDWEKTITVPDWYGLDYPLLINTAEPLEEKEPPVPKTYDEQADNYSFSQVADRDRWEGRLLRREFDRQLTDLGRTDFRSALAASETADSLKSDFIQGVGELSDFWERSRNVLRQIKKNLDKLDM
ncbi:hypothetical protein G7054_g1884 [Neopestalotiopsis clavispora]|nr:hypothetical protein G7054_g1884 [Neopestalotiopsis clavispora]